MRGYWVVLQNERVGAADERASQVNHIGHRGDLAAAAPLLAQARPAAPAARRCPAREAGGRAARSCPFRRPGSRPQTARPLPLPPSTAAAGDVGRAQRPGPAVYFIQQIGREGLEPRRLRPGRADRGDAPARSAGPVEGSDRPVQPASSDLALGHVQESRAVPWFVTDPDLDAAQQDDLLRRALAAHRITAALNGLLPTHPQYAALRRRWKSRRQRRRPRSAASA